MGVLGFRVWALHVPLASLGNPYAPGFRALDLGLALEAL